MRVDDHRLARLVDRAAVEADRRRRLHRDRRRRCPARSRCRRECRRRCSRGSPAGVISSECSVPLLRDAREAGADLDALHRVDAHHRLREVGVEPAVDRLAPADRHAARDDRRCFAPQESPDLRSASMNASSSATIDALATKNGLASTCAQSSNGIDVGAELRQMAANRDAVALGEPLACDRAGRDAHRRLARRLRGRRRDSRGCRTSASTRSRRARAETSRRSFA